MVKEIGIFVVIVGSGNNTESREFISLGQARQQSGDWSDARIHGSRQNSLLKLISLGHV